MSVEPIPGALMCASRRAALGIAGGGALAGALAACGGGNGGAGGGYGGEDASPKEKESDSSSAPEGDGGALGQVADIPVGGGAVFAAQKVVVTQPEEGTILGFSAECTHKGCLVDEVADGQIKCPCHQSSFAIADGAVTGGPAEKPLPKVEVAVDGGQITLA
ncbi:nitrite reductase/ring-hydroxylating ferredoxin subunit [Murinocardiopsis flavida]|uniref:Cytochrome bc1 complex Rieske iron-sulfur subunit n=1 Tax=Murinocardiopsis flavida TaxID=645275 RepID=A0A2P8DEB8_9ACTN|nr:Rieske (2Fe-2S) protein [Murinocardiopsis flavida]PSK95574.1 nitrite reductase/ring-hydroxylating ferredoxin subunit [Murinocardiopsis flavida]